MSLLKKELEKLIPETQQEIKSLIAKKGDTQINLIITENNKKAHFSFQNNRKFDLKNLETLKAKEYVRKITL